MIKIIRAVNWDVFFYNVGLTIFGFLSMLLIGAICISTVAVIYLLTVGKLLP